jgi:hypothetical protein
LASEPFATIVVTAAAFALKNGAPPRMKFSVWSLVLGERGSLHRYLLFLNCAPLQELQELQKGPKR